MFDGGSFCAFVHCGNVFKFDDCVFLGCVLCFQPDTSVTFYVFRITEDAIKLSPPPQTNTSIVLLNAPKPEPLILLRHLDKMPEPLFELGGTVPRALNECDADSLVCGRKLLEVRPCCLVGFYLVKNVIGYGEFLPK